MSSIVLMVWINDDPIQGNILKISTIVEPRIAFDEYREGQRVRVKCPGFGIQTGVIGKIGDDSKRKEFQELLSGPGFKKIVDTVCGRNPNESDLYQVEDTGASSSGDGGQNTTAAPTRVPRVKKRSLPDMHQDESENEANSDNSSEHGGTSGDDIQPLIMNRPTNKKKAKTLPTNQDIEALKVKKDVAKAKRDAQKAREKVNQMVSSVLVDGDEHEDNPSTSEKLTAIVNNTKTILELMHQLVDRQEDLERQLTEVTSCKQCVKAMYKKLKPTLDTTPSTKRLATPTGRCLPVCSPQQTSTQPGSEEVETRVEPMEEDIQLDTADQETEQLEATENNDELAFLGDSKFGVLVDQRKLQNCEMASSKIDKLALNILELLVTKDECANLSIYGQAKGKVAMAPAKRKALRSHLFQVYGKSLRDDQKEALWTNDIVKKLNDKIRGIKNNKYKL